MLSRPDPSVAVLALMSAAPYIRMYKNKVFVIKAGGAVFSDEASTRALIEQVAILHQVGIKTVLVHGGGPQLDSVQATLGIETRMVNGRRVTDQKSIDVTAMVLNGLINTRILAICRQLGIEAIGLSGVDAGLIRAHKRAPVPVSPGSSETVDYGFVGDIDSVNVGVIEKLLENGLMPVVSPLSADSNGTLLNINADTVAAAIGGALSAEKLVLCTGAPGHSRAGRGPQHGDFLHRHQGFEQAARCRTFEGRHAAQGHGDRERHSRRRAARPRHHLQILGQPAGRDFHQRRHRHAGRRGPQGVEPGGTAGCGDRPMTRLWDKGAPLDARVLAYTAGDDYLLDNRLVAYDVRASIAHAEMLGEQGLVSSADLAQLREALLAIGEEHAQGKWRITLEQEDCQTAIENLLTARIGATGGRLHAGRSRNDQVLAALRLYLRDAAQALHAGAIAVAEALDALATRDGPLLCRATRTCNRPCPAPWPGGREGSPPRFAMTPRACSTHSAASARILSGPLPATAHPISISAAKPRATA
jgi:acetylglutamate kinase